MKFSTLLLGCYILSIFCSCNPAASSKASKFKMVKDAPTDAKPGECHAKCIITDKSETNTQVLAVYTGDEVFEEVDIEIRKIVMTPASSKWEKKKADKECLSPDPNDCLVWCLVDVPEESKEYKILLDTTQSPNFEMQEVATETLTKKGGYTEWRQILCANKITTNIIGQIQEGLAAQKYYEGEPSMIMDSKTKSALSMYQKANGLPVGQLDLETLDMLGILVE